MPVEQLRKAATMPVVIFDDDGRSLRISGLDATELGQDGLDFVINERIIPWFTIRNILPDHVLSLQRVENIYFDDFDDNTLRLLGALVVVQGQQQQGNDGGGGGGGNNNNNNVERLVLQHPNMTFLHIIARALPNLKRTFVYVFDDDLFDDDDDDDDDIHGGNVHDGYVFDVLQDEFPTTLCFELNAILCELHLNTTYLSTQPFDEHLIIHLIRGLFEVPSTDLVNDIMVSIDFFLLLAHWISKNQNRWNEIWNGDIIDGDHKIDLRYLLVYEADLIVDKLSLTIAVDLIFKLTHRYCNQTLKRLIFDDWSDQYDIEQLIMLKTAEIVHSYQYVAKSLQSIRFNDGVGCKTKFDRIMFDDDSMNNRSTIITNPTVFSILDDDDDDDDEGSKEFNSNKNKFTFNDQIRFMLDLNGKVKQTMLQLDNSSGMTEVWTQLLIHYAERIPLPASEPISRHTEQQPEVVQDKNEANNCVNASLVFHLLRDYPHIVSSIWNAKNSSNRAYERRNILTQLYSAAARTKRIVCCEFAACFLQK